MGWVVVLLCVLIVVQVSLLTTLWLVGWAIVLALSEISEEVVTALERRGIRLCGYLYEREPKDAKKVAGASGEHPDRGGIVD